MNSREIKRALIILLLICNLPVTSSPTVEKNEYRERREMLMNLIPDGITIVLGANTPLCNEQFYQNNDFYYFTGAEIPDAILVMDAAAGNSIMFFSVDANTIRALGLPEEVIDDPVNETGMDMVLPLEDFIEWLGKRIEEGINIHTIFYPEELPRENTKEKRILIDKTMTSNPLDGRLSRELQFVKNIGTWHPSVSISDCSSIIWDMRRIKSESEIGIIRKACALNVKAHMATMMATRPGVPEYRLASLFEYTCRNGGAMGLSFETIIMSDKNLNYGHYWKHDGILKDGGIVILDAGPDYEYYDVDISTTFPVNGRFSEKQNYYYQLAYDISRFCISSYKPGITFGEIGQKVKKFLSDKGLDPDDPLFRNVIRYAGYNHTVGLATHDPQGSFAGPEEVLKPGFVFVCDIGFNTRLISPVPGEEISIRIEDVVVITKDGCELLSDGLPRSIPEIEKYMNNNRKKNESH